ncbi:MAG: hypothetical protein QM737_18220 [Ferruginibacter sp.]
MKSYLSFILILIASHSFAQHKIPLRDSSNLFNNEGSHHTLELKGLNFIYPLGNGHILGHTGGIGIKILKRHHVGFDVGYVTGIDNDDHISDTLGVMHDDGAESRSKENVYTGYYHYHFNLFRLNEKYDLNFFVGVFYRHGRYYNKTDPFYQESYLFRKSTNEMIGFTHGVAKTFRDVRGLRIEGGLGIGQETQNDFTKSRKNGTIKYEYSKYNVIGVRIELGLYWTFL